MLEGDEKKRVRLVRSRLRVLGNAPEGLPETLNPKPLGFCKVQDVGEVQALGFRA